jgi:hypothetical protein
MSSVLGVLMVAVLACSASATPLVNRIKKCGFPNGTETNIHTYNCDGSQSIQILGSKILNAQTNASMYPIDVRKDIIIDLNATNNGIIYNDNKVNVQLKEYKTNWLTGKCEWSTIPTFGLLDGIDGCNYAHNCPLKTGSLDLRLPLDLSKFSAIINLIAGKNPYQVEIRMYDNNKGSQKEEISCVVAQLRFSES